MGRRCLLVVRGALNGSLDPMFACASHSPMDRKSVVAIDLGEDGGVTNRTIYRAEEVHVLEERMCDRTLDLLMVDLRTDRNLIPLKSPPWAVAADLEGLRRSKNEEEAATVRRLGDIIRGTLDDDGVTSERSYRGGVAREIDDAVPAFRIKRHQGHFTEKRAGLRHVSGITVELTRVVPESSDWKRRADRVQAGVNAVRDAIRVGASLDDLEQRFRQHLTPQDSLCGPVLRHTGYEAWDDVRWSVVEPYDVFTIGASVADPWGNEALFLSDVAAIDDVFYRGVSDGSTDEKTERVNAIDEIISKCITRSTDWSYERCMDALTSIIEPGVDEETRKRLLDMVIRVPFYGDPSGVAHTNQKLCDLAVRMHRSNYTALCRFIERDQPSSVCNDIPRYEYPLRQQCLNQEKISLVEKDRRFFHGHKLDTSEYPALHEYDKVLYWEDIDWLSRNMDSRLYLFPTDVMRLYVFGTPTDLDVTTCLGGCQCKVRSYECGSHTIHCVWIIMDQALQIPFHKVAERFIEERNMDAQVCEEFDKLLTTSKCIVVPKWDLTWIHHVRDILTKHEAKATRIFLSERLSLIKVKDCRSLGTHLRSANETGDSTVEKLTVASRSCPFYDTTLDSVLTRGHEAKLNDSSIFEAKKPIVCEILDDFVKGDCEVDGTRWIRIAQSDTLDEVPVILRTSKGGYDWQFFMRTEGGNEQNSVPDFYSLDGKVFNQGKDTPLLKVKTIPNDTRNVFRTSAGTYHKLSKGGSFDPRNHVVIDENLQNVDPTRWYPCSKDHHPYGALDVARTHPLSVTCNGPLALMFERMGDAPYSADAFSKGRYHISIGRGYDKGLHNPDENDAWATFLEARSAIQTCLSVLLDPADIRTWRHRYGHVDWSRHQRYPEELCGFFNSVNETLTDEQISSIVNTATVKGTWVVGLTTTLKEILFRSQLTTKEWDDKRLKEWKDQLRTGKLRPPPHGVEPPNTHPHVPIVRLDDETSAIPDFLPRKNSVVVLSDSAYMIPIYHINALGTHTRTMSPSTTLSVRRKRYVIHGNPFLWNAVCGRAAEDCNESRRRSDIDSFAVSSDSLNGARVSNGKQRPDSTHPHLDHLSVENANKYVVQLYEVDGKIQCRRPLTGRSFILAVHQNGEVEDALSNHDDHARFLEARDKRETRDQLFVRNGDIEDIVSARSIMTLRRHVVDSTMTMDKVTEVMRKGGIHVNGWRGETLRYIDLGDVLSVRPHVVAWYGVALKREVLLDVVNNTVVQPQSYEEVETRIRSDSDYCLYSAWNALQQLSTSSFRTSELIRYVNEKVEERLKSRYSETPQRSISETYESVDWALKSNHASIYMKSDRAHKLAGDALRIIHEDHKTLETIPATDTPTQENKPATAAQEDTATPAAPGGESATATPGDEQDTHDTQDEGPVYLTMVPQTSTQHQGRQKTATQRSNDVNAVRSIDFDV